ncbi:hypothetical protein OH807_09570 [Kitasatospora sp. NBC_01560]|uniref:hypothetical protein n=1 Tax=Kitasatospora sp. NBC_01560 TaxID=2975965 RepID=UPI0038667040
MLLLLVVLAAPCLVLVLLRYGCVALVRHRGDTGRLVRGLSALAAAGAVALYLWGALHVGLQVIDAEDGGTDSTPLRPCRAAGMEKALLVDDYEVEYLPLGFVCHVPGGRSYAVDAVPGYVTPAVLALAAAAVLPPLAVAYGAEYRRRRGGAAPGLAGAVPAPVAGSREEPAGEPAGEPRREER